MNEFQKKIESILFFRGEETSVSYLAKVLEEKPGKIREEVKDMVEKYDQSSLEVIFENDKVFLGIQSKFSDIIEKTKAKETVGQLGKASLETLSVIMYKSPIAKAELDYIRGVNSNYILRSLTIRGLVEKRKEDGKTLYVPTIDLMRFMGISKLEDLPDFQSVRAQLESIKESDEKDKEGEESKEDAPEEEKVPEETNE